MPSLKRLQHSDSEDQSDGESESATTNPTPSSRKRARLSASLTSDVSGSNARGSISPSPSADDAPRDEDEDEIHDDASEDEDEDEEELEFRQTQIIQEKYAQMVDEANVPAEHGILERVECFNFMCHKHFSVELGPLINFIVGKNGSGKSAILTAITLCLGGKASATNRGQSLKSFIKEGTENATIMVRIKNQGEGAYLPDDYGKTIIVERHFSRSGSSGFKIKNHQGRIISTKKAELDAITDYFSLQIDNPMNVLSQDMARQFLSTSSPAEKYKFFVKGVQLEQLDQDYRLIEESVDQIEEKLKTQAPNIRFLENQRDQAKKKLELSDQQNFLRERIRKYRAQAAWALVEDQERIRDSLTEEVNKASEAITSAEVDLGKYDDALRNFDGELETAAEHITRAEQALEQCRKDDELLKDRVKDQTTELLEQQADQRGIKAHIESARETLEIAQGKVEAEEHRLVEVSNGGYARKQEECERAKADAAAARAEYESQERGQDSLREAVKAAERKVQEAQKQLEFKQQDLTQAKNRLQELTRENAQVKEGFPEKMPALLRAIQQERSWKFPPVGPIGHYVTLLKPKWSSIIETTLGPSLSSFVVKYHDDQQLLGKIMKRVGCHCQILVGSNENIDTSNNEPDSQYDTVLRVLKIDNDLVRGHLIVRHTIEKMLLVEDLEKASSLMYDGARLDNVQRCFSIDSKDQRRGFHLSYNREGAPTQSPVQAYKGYPRMKSDKASQTSHQREMVQHIENQVNELKKAHNEAVARVRSCRKDLSDHERKVQRLKVEMQKCEDHAESLKDALESAADGQLDALKKSLENAEVALRGYEATFEASEEAVSKGMKILRELRRAQKEKQRELATLDQNVKVAKEERRRIDNDRYKILSDKNGAIARIEDDKRNRDRLREKRDQIATEVLSSIEGASLVAARVPVDEGETAESLHKKLDRLKADLDRYSAQLGASREEIANEASATEARYRHALKQVEEMTALAQIFKDTLSNRKKRWEIFRSHISSRAKAQFTYLLSERSFRGRLLANHQEKLLDLQVEPDITKDDSTGRGAKTLSGGEKSFSQICLLLALWEAMGSPIRCLDEFDVYMDHINRKMAIDMLMIAARRSIGRQFILITPGTKTDITIAPDVRVKELAEPERGQTTLPYQR